MMLSSRNILEAWLTGRSRLLGGVAAVALVMAMPVLAQAQTLNERISGSRAGQANSRMLVDAREVEYDRNNDRVSAVGDVQIYYQGRILEADRVTYDRKNRRVRADGNVRMTEADGTKSYGNRFELTDDFRDGFIDSLRVETAEKTRFSAARAERTSGEQTVMDRGTFTACAPCKDNPEKPPLWQVKAAKIIHNNSEQRIYYENATLEFLGVPVAWVPYFSSPDPTVKRQSGVLAPRYIHKNKLGSGVSIPFYWAGAPHYDLTVTPTYFSRQGLHGDVVWRHRLENGQYDLRVNGIVQQDKSAFDPLPYAGGGKHTVRGSIASRGKFHLNEKWTFGWDATYMSDKFYFSDYKIKTDNIANAFFNETISSVYLRGRGERSWFDLSAYHFKGLGSFDWQPQMGTAAPTFDFDRRFTPGQLGGELAVKFNAAATTREAAFFQPLPAAGTKNFVPTTSVYDSGANGYYYACQVYTPGRCLLRGVAGDYVRASTDVSWRRRMIDPLGAEWTPFFGVRADVAWLQVNTSSYNTPSTTPAGYAPYGNQNQGAFFGGNADNAMARVMPMVGLEYRYPFFAVSSMGMHHFEPIAQIIVRPNEQRVGKLPNEDAQSLVFDDTSIFSLNKFSGYDRTEGGSRVNYGARYSFRADNGMFASLVFGQSVQISGKNSFAAADLANTGRDSGLESRQSDFVTAATLQPSVNTSFTARARFDEKTFAVRRIDMVASATFAEKLAVSALYTRIAPQPNLGYTLRREGVSLQGKLLLPQNFYVFGAVLFDLDRYLTEQALTGAVNTRWQPAANQLGIGYRDECTDLSLTYTRSYSDASLSSSRYSSTYMLKLVLRELGEAGASKKVTH